ncbi:MAG: DUF2807 domain-containing protein [Bacteroidetes bacterium]|nr:DUF2807 domain-containing protein [Bacteroidota bacterium]
MKIIMKKLWILVAATGTDFKLIFKMKRIVLLLFTSMLFLTACDKAGNGDVVSQERMANDFNGIVIDGVANVNVHSGEDYKVIVTTDINLQSKVLVEVKNNVLYIGTKSIKSFKPTKLIVDVHLPELQSINLKGVGNVKLSNGEASSLQISLSGAGGIDAQNYQVENVVINHSGVGDAKIWVTTSLSGTLSGVGDIYYKGNPIINVSVSGVGKLKKL